MLNGCKVRKITLTALLLLICLIGFTACGIEASSEVSSDRKAAADEDNEVRKTEAVKLSNEDTSSKALDGKVVISLQEGKLTVEQGGDKVQLDKDGLLVNEDKETVKITKDGIHVEDGNSQVNINASGIHVKDGLLGNSVDIDLSGINVEGVFSSFSLSDFLSEELPEIISDAQFEFNWNFFDDMTLLTKMVLVNGNERNISIRFKDGYLVTKNCNEDDTDVKGLTLVKTETDEKGNVYRYYSEQLME